MNNKIEKLNRFCLQTELAMTHLEALLIITDAETDIALMKSDLKKEKAKINNFLKFSNNILDIGHSSLALNKGLLILSLTLWIFPNFINISPAASVSASVPIFLLKCFLTV